MRISRWLRAAVVGLVGVIVVPTASFGAGRHEPAFERIATFPVYTNNDDPSASTVAEIVDVTDNGRLLAYTDGAGEAVGFVDIADPDEPKGLGTLGLGGEPTSVATTNTHAYVAVNTSVSFADPSGYLAVVRLPGRRRGARLEMEVPLAGQPDSVKLDPNGRTVAVVIENERDEGVADGLLPQAPRGLVEVIDFRDDWYRIQHVELAGLADYAPSDPEPEFVDIDSHGRAVVSMQENNHLAFIDLDSAEVTSHFSAGTVTLEGVDGTEDGLISMTETLPDVPREPDSIALLPGGQVATANEGDIFGGSRGFSIFDRSGEVLWDSGSSFEELAVRHGHYPESRSDAKGTEPEAIEYGKYGRDHLLFVGSERGSFVGVYDVGGAEPELKQFLPTGLGPEGLLAIPQRDLFVASTEEDDPEHGVRSTISIYQRSSRADQSVDVVSADGPDGKPIAWSALSGMVSDPADPDTAYAVWDSYYAESRIFALDIGSHPAVVRNALTLTDGGVPVGYDLEGIAIAEEGGYWVVSEGSVSVDEDDPSDFASTPNLLIRVADDGSVQKEIGLPEEVLACWEETVALDDGSIDRDFRRNLRYGFEGVTVASDGSVVVAQQLGWAFADITVSTSTGDVDCADLSDDPDTTRVWSYRPDLGTWDHVSYETEEVSPNGAWVGLSEVTALPDGGFVFIERDNVTGDWTELKQLVRVDGIDGGIDRSDKSTADLIGPLREDHGWITDKPEGVAIATDGQVYVVTDNDGVDGWSGETWFLRLGPLVDLF